jgi:hypothetical protein
MMEDEAQVATFLEGYENIYASEYVQATQNPIYTRNFVAPNPYLTPTLRISNKTTQEHIIVAVPLYIMV